MSIKNTKRITSVVGTLFIIFLLVSSVTAVPQKQAEIINEKIDKKEQLNQFLTLIENQKEDQSSAMYMIFLLNIADALIIEIQKNAGLIDLSEKIIFKAIPNTDQSKNTEDIATHALSSLENLQELSISLSVKKGDEQTLDIPFLQSLIAMLISFIKEYLLGGDTSSDSNDNNNTDWLAILKEILGVFITIITYILKGIVKGLSLLLGGIFRIIGALITMVILMIAGLQTLLTVGALFLIFMGFISKIGIKIVSTIAAPIFALLAAQFTMSLGTLLGGISMALHAVLAFALFFAIPILLIVGVFLLLGSENDGGGGETLFDFSNLNFDGPFYMLISILLNKLKA